MEFIIQVDEKDRQIGPVEKMVAHRDAVLHRAFSILIFNSKNELLLQKRDINKYHSGGLWTNTCCSHPRFMENLKTATKRRLQEEMGFTCDLKMLFDFIYKAEFENGLFEHEYDYVFMGRYDGDFVPNPFEVASTKWMSLEDIEKDIVVNPDIYTHWFKILIPKLKGYFRNLNNK